MLIQAPADTLDFMIMGFAVIFLTIAIYLISFVTRFRNLRKDYTLIREIEEKQ